MGVLKIKKKELLMIIHEVELTNLELGEIWSELFPIEVCSTEQKIRAFLHLQRTGSNTGDGGDGGD